MRPYVLPKRYFAILFLIILAMMGVMVLAEYLSAESLGPELTIIIESPFTNPLLENIFETLVVAILILILYTIGVYFIVRKIQEEASRFAAVRIFTGLLLALAFFLAMLGWVDNAGQIALIVGIIWGALLVALRDLIQNLVGSLVLFVTRVYRIGDRIFVRGVYGVVMDIGVFRTTVMKLDEANADYPTGKIATIPNGVLFREVVTNESRDLSFTSDEIRLSLPLSADVRKAGDLVLSVVQKHTGTVRETALKEIERLGEKKYLPAFDGEPALSVQFDRQQVLVVVKYLTDSRRGPEIKKRIVEEISALVPGITEGAG